MTPVNDAPVAVNDSFNDIVGDSTANPLNVLSNDNAGGGETQTLTIISTSTPANGSVAIVNGGASLQYTPRVGFEGNDSFTYTISDGQATATATVSLNVITPKTPFARGDSASLSEISAGGVATGLQSPFSPTTKLTAVRVSRHY